MEKLYSTTTIHNLKSKYGFQFSKGLGQNFLTDGNVVDRIIAGTEITKDDLVIEIGPGIGVLTAAAAEQAGQVIGVEIDRNLIPILGETLKEYPNVTILHQDFMRTDLESILGQAGVSIEDPQKRTIKIIGNLPYYITTPILMKILEDQSRLSLPLSSLTMMMQKEVADRIRALPGSKAYGALSVAVQFHCTVSVVAAVSKEVFLPKPKVDSTVLLLTMRETPPVTLKSEALFFGVVKAGFGQRRKTLENALSGFSGIPKQEMQQILSESGIHGMRRAETLTLDEFAQLSNTISKHINDQLQEC